MFTDEKDLVKRITEGDEVAFTELSERYIPLIRAEVRRFAPSFVTVEGTPRLSAENLELEARMALYRAACSFDSTKGNMSFGLYAKICIRNALVSELRRVHPHKREHVKSKEETHTAAKSVTEAERQAEMLLRSQAEELLSDYEKKVFGLYLQGLPPRTVALQLGKTEKSVYNALCRIRNKIHGTKNSHGSMP